MHILRLHLPLLQLYRALKSLNLLTRFPDSRRNQVWIEIVHNLRVEPHPFEALIFGFGILSRPNKLLPKYRLLSGPIRRRINSFSMLSQLLLKPVLLIVLKPTINRLGSPLPEPLNSPLLLCVKLLFGFEVEGVLHVVAAYFEQNSRFGGDHEAVLHGHVVLD